MLVLPSKVFASAAVHGFLHVLFAPLTALGGLLVVGVGIAAHAGYFGAAFGRLLRGFIFWIGVHPVH